MRFNKSFFRLNLDPNTEGGGAGGAGADLGAGGGAGGAEGGGAGGSSPSYLPESKFTEFTQGLDTRFSEITPRLEKIDEFLSRFDTSKKSEQTGEPKLGSPEYPSTTEGVQKWIGAIADYRADQKVKTFQETSKKESESSAAEASRRANIGAHVKRIGEAAVRYKDWNNVVKDVNLPGNLSDKIMESDFSADIQYLINRDKGVYFQLLDSQSKGSADRFIGRLEQRFETEAAARKQAGRQSQHGTTIDDGMDAGGNTSRLQELEDIANESYGLKK